MGTQDLVVSVMNFGPLDRRFPDLAKFIPVFLVKCFILRVK
jgi:hypothetical protein